MVILSLILLMTVGLGGLAAAVAVCWIALLIDRRYNGL
jgi:hypothetical protein